ncbi:MAG: nitroreductase/quinone reductase family protein [Actinomycetota bacterium]
MGDALAPEPDLAAEDYCYITTRGRQTGRPHEIEIWFAVENDCIYMLSGAREKSDWVRNIRNDPRVEVRIADRKWSALARLVGSGEEDELARRLLLEKYGSRYGGDLSSWGEKALPVAIDLAGMPG